MNANRRIKLYSYVTVLVIIVTVIYNNTLRSPFLLDDYGNIVGNYYIEINDLSLDSIRTAWTGPHIENSRNLSYLTFALNYSISGYNPISFHVVNIAIHISCALLIYLFLYQTLAIGWLKEKYGEYRQGLCVTVALIWALHPVQINAVTYIVQRMTSLAVLFALISMTTWLSARSLWAQSQRFLALFYWILSLSSWCLGLLSKEHVAIVPLLIMVHEVFLLRRGAIYRIQWRWVILGVMSTILMALFYLGMDPLHRILAGYAKRDFTLTERLLTESRVLWHYVFLFFFPVSERFTLFYEYPISRGFFSPITTCLSIATWIFMISSAWVYRKKYPVFTWMTAWFLAAHLIESTVIPLEIIFEHRMYLPSIGLAIGSVLLGFDFTHERTMKRWITVSVVSVIACILSIATYTRNMDFKDEVTLYAAELSKYPNSDRNRLGLALALNRAGRISEGGQMLKKMAGEAPHDFVIQQNWYNFLVRLRYDQATSEVVYHNLVQLIETGRYNRYHDAMALKNLAELLFEEGDYSRAILMLDRLVADYPRSSFLLLKGICHTKLNEWSFAKQAFHKAWKRDSQDINMIYWYSQSLIHSGEQEAGCRMLAEGIEAGRGDQKVVSMCQKMIDLQCVENRSKL